MKKTLTDRLLEAPARPGTLARGEAENQAIAKLGIECRKAADGIVDAVAPAVFEALGAAMEPFIKQAERYGPDVEAAVWNNGADALIKALKRQLER